MRISRIVAFLLIPAIVSIQSCGRENSGKQNNPKASSITLFAASSLTEVLSQLVVAFEAEYPVKVKISTASSGTLARQIEQGAKPDLYLSANSHWVNYLDSLGYMLQGSASVVAKNELVLIGQLGSDPVDSSLSQSLLSIEHGKNAKLSMGKPAHVPAGLDTYQSLKYLGRLEEIEQKLIFTKDVRAALKLVELGEVSYGAVYKTDALRSKKVRILGKFPSESHEPIVYTLGTCTGNPRVDDFRIFLSSEKGQALWQEYGFSIEVNLNESQ